MQGITFFALADPKSVIGTIRCKYRRNHIQVLDAQYFRRHLAYGDGADFSSNASKALSIRCDGLTHPTQHATDLIEI